MPPFLIGVVGLPRMRIDPIQPITLTEGSLPRMRSTRLQADLGYAHWFTPHTRDRPH